MVDPQLLELLVCPACRGEVKLAGDRIVCQACGRRYPVRDGIPVMLIEEAEGGPEAERSAEEPEAR
ncbi:MAG: hypothetical protein C4345_15210 [Chloroflexota bacterium]